MSASRLGTDPCGSVGLVGLPFVVGELEIPDGDRPWTPRMGTDPVKAPKVRTVFYLASLGLFVPLGTDPVVQD
jgi:hypothetical protein